MPSTVPRSSKDKGFYHKPCQPLAHHSSAPPPGGQLTSPASYPLARAGRKSRDQAGIDVEAGRDFPGGGRTLRRLDAGFNLRGNTWRPGPISGLRFLAGRRAVRCPWPRP